ncbi:MAG: endolytic transglycosylase MltG, partial [Rhizobiales bacterium]|nr:endolytic transglycosylase MltG [Hyphomicrobiales bacterium]
GSYEIVQGVTPMQVLEKLTRGDVTQAEIVLLEGWTFRQMRAALDAHAGVRHDTAGWTERQIMEKLAAEGPAEGRFFPDTYLFAKGSGDLDILKRAYRHMNNILLAEWEGREPSLPYKSPYEALIMASIVEKETGRSQDRTQVASVFLNRLRIGMLLQTDPTVIYGLGEKFDGNLRKRDLLADGPYNTYIRPGLPPTPIAMPGLASVQAVMRPAATEMLYFVARGDGSSQFSRTLEEHNRAVAKYQLRKGN